MSLTEKNQVEKNRYELTIHVSAEDLENAIEKAYRKNVKRINVPGFRQGKAPRKMIEKLYGEGFFYEEAINALYPDALRAAVEEAALELVAPAEVEAKEINRENGFTFVAKCVVKPEVSLKEYKGLEVEKHIHPIDEADVDRRIEAMRNRNARLIEVTDRETKKGDQLLFDFEGSIDGVPFEGGKAEKFSLEIGSGQFIPGFEEQLENRKIGEDFDVTVTFPEEYQAKELAGKEAVFKCRIHAIKEKELPELDDEFAKDVSEFETLDELKADIRGKMQEQADHAASDAMDNQLIDKVIDAMEADIPQEMYEVRIDEMVQDFSYRLQAQGTNLDTYLQYTQMTPESFRLTFDEQAKRQVKIRLALEKIVELENITVTDEDFDQERQKIAEAYQIDAAEVDKFIQRAELEKDIAVNKAVDLVRESAKVTEVADEPEKKPAKKSTAKKTAKKEEE